MDWAKLIQELLKSGMTQMQIALECGVAQSSVSEMARGKVQSPSYEFGRRVIELHRKRVGRGVAEAA